MVQANGEEAPSPYKFVSLPLAANESPTSTAVSQALADAWESAWRWSRMLTGKAL